MNQEQIQQEISIIKNMIEKTKKDTAESGSIFLTIGIGCILLIIIANVLEMLRLFHWILPTMITLAIIFGVLVFLLMRTEEKKQKVETYPKKINRAILCFCSLPIILTGLIFPLTKVYAWEISPIFSALFFGVMLFASGVICEFRFFYSAGLVSWIGACVMAYTLDIHFPIRGITLIIILITGFIIPGIILNKKYKNGSDHNES